MKKEFFSFFGGFWGLRRGGISLNRVNDVLGDTSKFKKLEKSEENEPLKIVFRLEDKINRFLRKIFGLDASGNRCATYKKISVSGSNLGVLYGLPKVHKDNHPVRPILSACNTPAYDLAKYLVPILSPITTNNFTIKDSFSFAKEISDFPCEKSSLASFDVKSLFTNIPLQETLDIILFELFENPENSGNITLGENEKKLLICPLPGNVEEEVVYYDKETFRKLLELATLDSYFLFNGELYHQIDGVAMGSPLGPTLANVFMSHMEKKWLQSCPVEFKPILYKRYVDDSFLIFKDGSQIDPFLSFLNSQHPNISFTSEKETDGVLSFLDINIKHTPKNFATSIYRKPTFTGLMSKFYDFSPQEYKSNLISTLVCRAFRISSSYLSLHNEFNFLKELLQGNGYPLAFIEKTIGRMLKNFTNLLAIVKLRIMMFLNPLFISQLTIWAMFPRQWPGT